MKKIHSLPQTIISKIAAGEVIERPAYAVKELIENSLDAGATEINIHIEESGLKKITVIDNGEGMSKEDLLECFKPHTTSKLSSENELSHISTLGFRGEALSSIAAISTMHIKSKTNDATAGTQITIKAGVIEKTSAIGMPVGTQITIEQLFASVPGRKKFLKSQRTEFTHILDVVTHSAIAYPQVQFVLHHNGKQIFDLVRSIKSVIPAKAGIQRTWIPGQARDDREINDSKLDRIRILLGTNFYNNLLPINYEDSYIKISGFLAKPHITASSLHKQFIYINNRKISNRIISLALREGYGSLIPSGSYPVGLLFLSLPYETVDVNVHPRKEEVRFIDNALISDAVQKAVKQTLSRSHLTNTSYWDEEAFADTDELKDAVSSRPDTRSYAGRLLKQTFSITENHPDEIIQLYDLYLLVPSRYGLVLIDQHAAHERILYEQISQEFMHQTEQAGTHQLHKPVMFDVSYAESELLHEHIELFAKLGFEIEHFKDNTFLCHTVPHLLQDRNTKQLVMELLEDLKEDKKLKQVDQVTSRMIAYLACRAAVKAGDKLSKKQIRDLLDQLGKTPNNATCPHGRPVKVEIDLGKINKLFKR